MTFTITFHKLHLPTGNFQVPSHWRFSYCLPSPSGQNFFKQMWSPSYSLNMCFSTSHNSNTFYRTLLRGRMALLMDPVCIYKQVCVRIFKWIDRSIGFSTYCSYITLNLENEKFRNGGSKKQISCGIYIKKIEPHT